MERWPSGLRRTTGNRVYRQKRYRGFKSHPLRMKILMLTQKIHILDLSKEELQNIITKKLLQKPYRTKQILNWIYKKKVDNFKNFSDLPEELRHKLEEKFEIYSLKLNSLDISKIDATTRYNFKTKDGHIIPTVFIPKFERNVVCISTQIGCSIKCSFCNSGRVNFVRNLTCGEIVEQIIRVEKDKGKINGVLFMGMGEPLLNYENITKSIKILTDQDMFGLAKRRITVSTVGVVPNIYKLAEENLGIKLALSLHSYNDKKRKKFVKNLNFKIEDIIKAGIFYAKKTKTKLTIEYVMIKNENDTLQDAKGLIEIIKSFTKDKNLIKINLIPLNEIPDIKALSKPEEENIKAFKDLLVKNGYLTFVRKPYGIDIQSACGQLGY